MQITIRGTPKEIAALVFALQEWQPRKYEIKTVGRLDRQTLQSVIRGETDGAGEKPQRD